MSEALAQALALVGDDQLGAVAAQVAEGRVVELRPSPRARPAWLIDSRPPDLPGRFKLWAVGGDRVEHGPRAALVAALHQRLRDALSPWEGRATVPPWVELARLGQVALLAAEG